MSSCPLQDSVVDRIILHVDRVGAHGVPAAARSAATVFIADTFAVGITGSVRRGAARSSICLSAPAALLKARYLAVANACR